MKETGGQSRETDEENKEVSSCEQRRCCIMLCCGSGCVMSVRDIVIQKMMEMRTGKVSLYCCYCKEAFHSVAGILKRMSMVG